MTNHDIITYVLFALFGLCSFFLGAAANNLDWKKRLGSSENSSKQKPGAKA